FPLWIRLTEKTEYCRAWQLMARPPTRNRKKCLPNERPVPNHATRALHARARPKWDCRDRLALAYLAHSVVRLHRGDQWQLEDARAWPWQPRQRVRGSRVSEREAAPVRAEMSAAPPDALECGSAGS